MKHTKKIIAVAAAAACTLAMGSMLIACNGGTDYTFEAENAAYEGQSMMGPVGVESDREYIVDGKLVEGKTVSGVNNFNTVGSKITWTVVSDADCTATLTLHAASAAVDLDMTTYQMKGLHEIDFGTTEALKFTCNDTEFKLKGKLAGSTWENGQEDMGAPGAWWVMGTASGKINLKAGENTIVLEIVGQNGGMNVDKIVIKASATLTEKAA